MYPAAVGCELSSWQLSNGVKMASGASVFLFFFVCVCVSDPLQQYSVCLFWECVSVLGVCVCVSALPATNCAQVCAETRTLRERTSNSADRVCVCPSSIIPSPPQ